MSNIKKNSGKAANEEVDSVPDVSTRRCSSVVEHVHGKDGVTGSIPVNGSIFL